MEITRQTDYAVRALTYLAGLPRDSRVSTSTISEAEKIPLPFLTKVISHLVKAGLVVTNRGMGGGVSMARPSEEITLLEIIEAVEGPVLFNRCLLREGVCDLEPQCAAHDVWATIQARMIEELSSVTVNRLTHKRADG
jgi:Rrf2 family transcriptional regulator, iron-sulfur cluster assembly transcription factor